jgi:paraquat-inducible protein B
MGSCQRKEIKMDISNPQVSKQSGPSIIWLIPLITLMVGGWLIVKTLSEQGPRATISFKTAEGIEVGKTKVKYKNVDIGIVEQIKFSDDFSNIILTIEFSHGSEKFLRRNTRFWVVKPQLGLQGASGLGTLISGAYIEIEPGPGTAQLHFIGLEKQPVVLSDEQGKKIVLVTQHLGSVDTGSPVYYQGLLAGEVLGTELGNDRKSTYIHAFIKDPFDQLIFGNTNFWNVSGINVSMGANGFKVRTESIRSMMFGGIAFETPETLEQSTTDIDNLIFTLHQSYESIQEHAFTKKIKFIMFFDSSIRGLNLGAPVEFKGIKVGSVVDVRLEFNSKDTTFRIPVLIEIEPQRIVERGNLDEGSSYLTLSNLVKRGLRARLQTGSLLTSQLFVELDMHPESPIVLSGGNTQYPELPTLTTANFGALAQSAEALLAKLNSIDIEKVSSALVETIESANKTINNTNALVESPSILVAIEDMRLTMENFKSIVQKVDASNLIESASNTINNANTIIESPSILEAIEDVRLSMKNVKNIMQKMDDTNLIESASNTINNANTIIESPSILEAIEDMQLSMRNFKNIMQKMDDTNLVENANNTINNANTLLESPSILEAIEDMRLSLKNVKGIIQKVDDSGLIESAKSTLNNADETIKNTNNLIVTSGIPEAIEDMRLSLQQFKKVMQKVDDSNLQEAINSGYLLLDSLSITMKKVNTMLEPNSPIQYNLIELTDEFGETARSIRSLIETLERNPQELIFGKTKKTTGE